LKPIVEHKERWSKRGVGGKLADSELYSPPWYPTIRSGRERGLPRALCDWAKREEYVEFKMKRQPSQLKTELRAHGAWERRLHKGKCLFANSFLCSKCSQDLWQKEFLDTGLSIELLAICG
jgi:hypothetical protein